MRQRVLQLAAACCLVSACSPRGADAPAPLSYRAIAPKQAMLNVQANRTSATTFYVKGRHLYDRCGEQVVLRGVNKMSVWTDPRGAQLPEIAKTGANAVRIVWTIADHPRDLALDHILDRAVEARLIPMIELHDATGDFGKLDDVMNFWTRPRIVEILKDHERHLLLNIANEAGDGSVTPQQFADGYTRAVQRLRGNGIKVPIVIDASRWGQDIDVLQATAGHLLETDSEQNLLFSAHLWWPEAEGSKDPGAKQRIVSELQQSIDMELPLIIGEFAPMGVGCKGSIDYRTILAEAQRHDIGWLAWSWGPGNKDCKAMDMTTDGSFESLHGWGREVAMTDPNSIENTSKIPYSIKSGRCLDEAAR